MKTRATLIAGLLILTSTVFATNYPTNPSEYDGRVITKEKLQLNNNTFYGDLHIDGKKDLILKQNDYLIIDGNLLLQEGAKMTVAEGANLIVTGSLLAGERFKGTIDGFAYIKDQIHLKEAAKITGNGKVRSLKGTQLEKDAELFGIKESVKMESLYQGNSLTTLFEMRRRGFRKIKLEDHEGNKPKAKRSYKVTFSNEPYLLKKSSVAAALENELEVPSTEEISYNFRQVANQNQLLLTFSNPASLEYKITLSDSNGRILSRKLTYLDESTIEHEEEIIHGAELIEGDYYIKVRSSHTNYILPFEVK